MEVYIYELICPITYKIRYIGKTKKPRVDRREYEHTLFKKDATSPIDLWENDLRYKGLKPIIEIIDECDESVWGETETWWIKKFKEAGIDLLNVTPGGDAINVPITENHNSKFLNGNHLEDYYTIEQAKEIREKISKSSSGENNPNYGGKLLTDEYIKKQIISNSKVKIKLIDTFDNNREYVFINSKEAGKFAGRSESSVRMAKSSKYKLKHRYIVQNV